MGLDWMLKWDGWEVTLRCTCERTCISRVEDIEMLHLSVPVSVALSVLSVDM